MHLNYVGLELGIACSGTAQSVQVSVSLWKLEMCSKDAFPWPFSGSWAQLCMQHSSLHGHRAVQIHKFLLPISVFKLLVSNIPACHLCFQATMIRGISFHFSDMNFITYCTHNTEQRPLKCPPVSFKIASVMFCILGVLSSSSCDEGSRLLRQYDVEVTLSYIPRCSQKVSSLGWN